MLIKYKGISPTVPDSCYLFPYTTLLGNVILEENVVICPGCNLRAEYGKILIGEGTNIQDGSTLHVEIGLDVIVGAHVTVGHNAILHGCTVKDHVLIGMGAIIQDGAVIGENSFIGAGSLVKQGMIVPPGHVAYGAPAKIIRPIRQEEWEEIRIAAQEYQEYREELKKS